MRAGAALIITVVALLTFGVVMVNSAGLTVQPEQGISLEAVMTGRPARLALMAIAALALGAFVPVRSIFESRGLRSPIPWIILAAIGLLLLVHVPGIGLEKNGARRWVDLGIVSFQPSEVAKWGLPIVLAWYACRNAALMRRFLAGFLPPILLVGLVCTLVATEDLGTGVLIGMVGTGVLIAAGARLIHVLPLAPAGLGAAAILVYASPYRLERIHAFVDPYQDPQGIGYHMLQSMAAVSGGGLAGRGLGNSVQKFGYLPEDTTDFIFAIICEEMGLVGALLVVFLYAVLLLGGLAIVRRASHPFLRLVGLAVILTIGLQALINMAVVTGSAPTKGIALPLLSSGGTGWILTAFSVGLLVAIERDSRETAGAPVDSYDTGAAAPMLSP